MAFMLCFFVCFQCWRKFSIFAHAFSMSSCFLINFLLLFIGGSSGGQHRLIFYARHKLTNTHCNTAIGGSDLKTLIECYFFSRTLREAVPKIPFSKCLILLFNNLSDVTLFFLIQCLILFLVFLLMLGTHIPA